MELAKLVEAVALAHEKSKRAKEDQLKAAQRCNDLHEESLAADRELKAAEEKLCALARKAVTVTQPEAAPNATLAGQEPGRNQPEHIGDGQGGAPKGPGNRRRAPHGSPVGGKDSQAEKVNV